MNAVARKFNRMPLAALLDDKSTDSSSKCGALQLERWIRVIRAHLGMDVAFVSEFDSGCRLFRWVDSCLSECPIATGHKNLLEETFCQRVVDGRFPELMPCVSNLSEARALSERLGISIGAHLSVPIRLKDGEVFGTFCCFSAHPNYELTERDLALMRAVADLLANSIEDEREAKRHAVEARARIKHVISQDDALSVVYQPILRLVDRRVVGYEALARFNHEPKRGPDQWFAEAAECGLGPDLELKAIAVAVKGLDRLPRQTCVSINASPDTIMDPRLSRMLNERPLQRVMLELTEHVVTTCYAQIADTLAPLRTKGLQLAVDDAGAGHSSFLHILSLSPDVIKLDIGLTRDIDLDANRRYLATALIGFAASTGARIVAEGVERQGELDTLKALGVQKAQGYFLGKPMPIDEALALTIS